MKLNNLVKNKNLCAVVTSGPTREYLDPIRYISNESSGKQGYEIALALKKLGIKTKLIMGPSNLIYSKGLEIKKIISSQKKLEKAIPAVNKTRLTQLNSKIGKLNVNLDPDKLNQEAALLILKHDVAEELERIIFHLDSMQKELSSKQAKGKKIDFILQELFRETSTLSVKLDKPSLKELALNMKLAVEEMREQAQNLE